MRIRKKNIKRLASLSALGAGALAVTAGNANANVIPIVLPGFGVTVGPNGIASEPINMLGAQINLVYRPMITAARQYYQVGLSVANGTFTFLLGPIGSQNPIKMVGANKTFNNAGGTTFRADDALNFVPIASRFNSGALHLALGNPSFSQQFNLFRFRLTDDAVYYGWVELTNVVAAGSELPSRTLGTGPNVTLLSYAYDDVAGTVITTPDLGGGSGSTVPEPSSFALAGLGALVLGAAGVRRWRTTRKAA